MSIYNLTSKEIDDLLSFDKMCYDKVIKDYYRCYGKDPTDNNVGFAKGRPTYTSQGCQDNIGQYPLYTCCVVELMSYDNSLTHFLLNIGMDIMGVERLISNYYLGSVNEGQAAICWRFKSDGVVHLNEKIMDINGRERIIPSKTIGTPLNANILTLNEDTGEVVECKPIYSDHLLYNYYNLGYAFFGGHLLNTRRGDRVMVVQEEVHALMGAYLFPQDVWIAVGHGQDLSEYLLSTLKATKIILYPDDMAFDYWERLAYSVDEKGKRLFPSVMVSDVFVKTDIHKFLTYHIGQQNSSQEQSNEHIKAI